MRNRAPSAFSVCGLLLVGLFAALMPSRIIEDRAVAAAPEPVETFADVPADHWAFGYVEALYRNGYIAGCNADPLLYCPEAGMLRSEGAVFVERGVRGSGYTPPEPTESAFGDVGLGLWFSKWVMGLWNDGYTAGCGTEPLVFCPQWTHTRAEATVFFERMLHGRDFIPPDSTSQLYLDVPLGPGASWFSNWVAAAHNDGLTEPCEDPPNRGDGLFRPNDGLTRAEGACMMAIAKGLLPPFENALFVATWGDDASPGSFALPFRTLRHAASVAQPGETIYIRGGNYVLSEEGGAITFQNSGRADAPITFTNYPGEQVIIQGARNDNPGTHLHMERYQRWGIFHHYGWGTYPGHEVDYVRILGTDVPPGPIPPSDMNPTLARTSTSGLVFANFDCAICVAGASYWEVAGVEIYNCGICGDGAGTSNHCTYQEASYGSAIFLERGVHDGNDPGGSQHTNFWHIHDNLIYSWEEAGAQINGDFNLIEDNHIFYGEVYGDNGAAGLPVNLLGHDNIVQHNVIHSIGQTFGGHDPAEDYAWGVLMEVDMADYNLVRNNVILNTQEGVTVWGGDNNLVQGNILTSDPGANNRDRYSFGLLSTAGWCDDYWIMFQFPQCPADDNNNCSYIHNGSPDCTPSNNTFASNTLLDWNTALACGKQYGGNGPCENSQYLNNAAGESYTLASNLGSATFTQNLSFTAADVVDAAGRDFHLTAGSTLRGSGGSGPLCWIPDQANSTHSQASRIQVPCAGSSDIGLSSSCMQAIVNRQPDGRVAIDDLSACFVPVARDSTPDVGAYEYLP